MAKSGRKRKKAEKSKTKLRQSIKLPKGLNETNATVTAKKITVLNQLRSQDTSEEKRVTRKKIGVRDLMVKVKSNGLSIKMEGLEGLNELLKAYPELCQEQLSQLCNTVIPVHNHCESKLRTAARSLITFLLTNVNGDHIEPMSPLIIAHLCCGLSHIDTDIQLDSLKLLDTLIESSPKVIILGHDQILPNCLDQVSLKAKDQMRSVNKNVSTKVTALQWRTEVLQRVLKILRLVQHSTEDSPMETEVHLTSFQQFHLGPVFTKPRSSLSLQEIITAGRDAGMKSSSNSFSLESFMMSLYNLLFHTWCESLAIVDKKRHGNSNLVGSDILPTLEIIVDLMVASKCQDDRLINHIVKNFPLELISNNESNNIHELNLNICLLALNHSNEHDDKVSEYLEAFQADNVSEATKLAAILMSLNETKTIKLRNVADQLAANFKNNELVTKALLQISQIYDIDNWKRDLPRILVSPKANSAHIEAMMSLFKKRDPVLMEALKSLTSLPNEFKNHPSTLDKIWRTLAVFSQFLGVNSNDFERSMETAKVSNSTRNYVNNLIQKL